MKNHEVLQKNHQAASSAPFKKIIYLTGLAGIMFGFNACFTSGYVSTVPTYVEHSRPAQPSNLHVWIDGDWGWNRPSHTYIQRDGYWTRPVQNRTYVTGTWRVTPKGHSYSPGRWKRQDR